jgi:hypothetical protein
MNENLNILNVIGYSVLVVRFRIVQVVLDELYSSSSVCIDAAK